MELGKVSIISKDVTDLSFVSTIAVKTGKAIVKLQEVKFGSVAQSLKDIRGLNGLFVRFDSEDAIRSFERETRKFLDPNIVYAFATEKGVSENPKMLVSPLVGSLIFLKSESPASAGEYIGDIISGCEQPGDLFSFPDKHIDDVKTILLQSKEKAPTVKALQTSLENLKVRKQIVAAATTALDEMIMNAFFDAPVDERGFQLYKNVDRTTNLDLTETGKQVEVSFTFTKDMFALTVVDHRGTLDRASILTHVCQCFEIRRNGSDVQLNKKSSGLGLAIVFRLGGSLLFRTLKGRKTAVTAFFRTNGPLKEMKKMSQFVIVKIENEFQNSKLSL